MVAICKEYLVSHGKTGVLGRFLAASPELLERGDRVVIQGDRGLSFGTVLCGATERQVRLLGPSPVGRLLRKADAADESARQTVMRREQHLFTAARLLAHQLALPLEVLDVELALDGRHVILQYLAPAGCDPTLLLERLAAEQEVEVWLENLVQPVIEEAHEHGGCGKPDCGKSEGGCSSCGTGGCSSCGSGKVDMGAYFAHLRDKMEKDPRTPLL
jgi:cell fate regulator YaaT (PSP1 superfamily)